MNRFIRSYLFGELLLGMDTSTIWGVPGRSRTGDLPLRRRLLYPLSYWDVVNLEGNLVMN